MLFILSRGHKYPSSIIYVQPEEISLAFPVGLLVMILLVLLHLKTSLFYLYSWWIFSLDIESHLIIFSFSSLKMLSALFHFPWFLMKTQPLNYCSLIYNVLLFFSWCLEDLLSIFGFPQFDANVPWCGIVYALFYLMSFERVLSVNFCLLSNLGKFFAIFLSNFFSLFFWDPYYTYVWTLDIYVKGFVLFSQSFFSLFFTLDNYYWSLSLFTLSSPLSC